MRRLANGVALSRNRKLRREAQLRRLAAMRAAKARKRLENPPEPKPVRTRWCRYELGFRDKLTGETAWADLRSVRGATIACRLLVTADQ